MKIIAAQEKAQSDTLKQRIYDLLNNKKIIVIYVGVETGSEPKEIIIEYQIDL